MNEIPREPKMRATTQAAEGVPRMHWTLAEFDRLAELGILTQNDRIELIGGELVPMSPKGNRHEVVRDELLNWMMGCLPTDRVRLSSEIGWRPGGDIYIEPDILMCPKAFKGVTVPAPEVLLAIEVADTSLGFDTSAKANLYATLGVREYWVVDANTLATRVHREPGAGGYRNIVEVASDATLTLHNLPQLSVRLVELSVD